MSLLKTKLQDDMKQAMREKKSDLVMTLRMALAAIQNEEIARKSRDGLSEQEEIAVVRKEIKKRQDALAVYEKAGDIERAGHEKAEVEILGKYVPASASREQIEAAMSETFAAHTAATQKDFGVLMKEAMAALGGNADGKVVSEVLKGRLAGK